MTRRHSNRSVAIGQERRADRLILRADQFGRRSARRYGVVLSLARVADLRLAIAQGPLPETIEHIGRVGVSADAYAVDFNGVRLIAVYDRRGQSITAFLPIDAPEVIWRPG